MRRTRPQLLATRLDARLDAPIPSKRTRESRSRLDDIPRRLSAPLDFHSRVFRRSFASEARSPAVTRPFQKTRAGREEGRTCRSFPSGSLNPAEHFVGREFAPRCSFGLVVLETLVPSIDHRSPLPFDRKLDRSRREFARDVATRITHAMFFVVT